MLTISANKRLDTPFTFELNGKSHSLKLTQFTVADHFRLIELQKPLFEDGKLAKDSTAKLLMSRIATSVKTESGDYFFTDPLDKLVEDIPAEAVFLLAQECDKLNPMQTGDLADKKK